MKKFLLILLTAVVLTSCEKEKKPLQFTNYSVEKSYDQCNPEEGDCAFISISYPVAKKESEAASRINEEVKNHIIKIVDYQEEEKIASVEDLAIHFIENYKNTARDFAEYELPWEGSVFAEIARRTPELISFRFNSRMFTGGAHGYSSISFLNFNPENGESYAHEELFTPEFKKFFEQRFREDQNIPQGDPINSTGLFFEDDTFVLPQNIGFTKSGIVLHYNAYEIASYAEGEFTYRFSYDEIEQYLKLQMEESPAE
ncbi:DUF3298 and DUF4163 domain-containing protein [Autumnicola musiva]|uniref:DUF4163 domain-containing protein n=1 Tax=Autumnicola musiva TaxID=3075589 RepID=A0ABU3D4J2_9FLAO|nr:DUF4163 domain-containing protein [Zunongwangia sp. F117]MDT0676448.1 DUF4163 domain-containing protein [Zunongwangia sp. F117]